MADNILLLGGGFIGQALAGRLAENGQSATIISRSTYEHQTNNINWLQGDLNDAELLRKQLSKCRAVVHLASTSTPGCHVHTPTGEVAENLVPLLRLLEVMGDHTDIPLVFLSSGGAIYGNPTTLPVSETHALAPLSNHAAGKAAAEHFLGVFAHRGHPVTILRPSNVYGPNQSLRSGFGVIRTILENIKRGTPMTIWGDGNIIRDYLYIDDLVTACIRTLQNPAGGVFNIGSGMGHSIIQLCALAERVTGKPLIRDYQPARGVDVQNIALDSFRFRKLYDWRPLVTMEHGLRTTWEWLQNQP